MERFVFSGGLTDKMVGMLQQIEEFEPMDVLVSQLDRHSLAKMRSLIEVGVVKSLFIDSGAYSVYTGNVDHIDVEEYIEFVNSIDDDICLIAQVDTLPGKFGEPKKSEDYITSAKLSWENYLYMRKRLKSPEKLIPVFHYGEPFDTLRNMLEWRDPEYDPESDTRKKNDAGQVWSEEFGWVYPDRVTVIGLSPANDSAQSTKNIYLGECYDVIAASSYPDARTHLFGMTSFDALKMFPCFSADSVSHRLRSAYNKVFTRKWGTIALSDRSRTSKTKSNMSFLRVSDERTLKEFSDLLEHYHLTIDQIRDDNAARVAVDIVESQLAVKGDWAYKPANRVKTKRLF